MRVKVTAVLLTLAAAGCVSTPPGQDPQQQKENDLQARVERLERIAANEAEVSQRLDEVQNEMRDLRGQIDELEHNNEKLTRQERDLYGDLDKRIAAMGGPAASTAGGGAAAAAGAAAGGLAVGAAAESGPSSTEQAVYNQAFDALKAGSYSTAITGFRDFLKNYPDSSLAENAQYWLGEAYYVNHEYDSATGAFRTVLKKWPDSRKAPDAMLKLGFTQYEQKQYGPARATLEEVTKKYPGTDSAKLASDRLRRIPAQPQQ
jgi:tol-pal system protein YbgF